MYVSRMGVIIQGDCYTYSWQVSIDAAWSFGRSSVIIGFPSLSVLRITYLDGVDFSRLIASWTSLSESLFGSLTKRLPQLNPKPLHNLVNRDLTARNRAFQVCGGEFVIIFPVVVGEIYH